MKICLMCGNEFQNDKHRQKYCSDLCSITARRIRDSKTRENREKLKKTVQNRRESNLDKMDPNDLLHYGEWQKKSIFGR